MRKLQSSVRQIQKRCRKLTKYAPVWKKSAGGPQRLRSKGTPDDCAMNWPLCELRSKSAISTPAQNTTCDSTELFSGLHRTTCFCVFGMPWQSISACEQQ